MHSYETGMLLPFWGIINGIQWIDIVLLIIERGRKQMEKSHQQVEELKQEADKLE